MKLEDQVTSLELSKKLKELGVKQDSLFQWGKSAYDGSYLVTNEAQRQVRKSHEFHDEEGAMDVYDLIPAFTVAELGEMLPQIIKVDEEPEGFLSFKNDDSMFPSMPKVWKVLYEDMVVDDQPRCAFQNTKEADARAEMLIYLLENDLTESK